MQDSQEVLKKHVVNNLLQFLKTRFLMCDPLNFSWPLGLVGEFVDTLVGW